MIEPQDKRCRQGTCRGFHFLVNRNGKVYEYCERCDFEREFDDRRREQRPFEGPDRRKGIQDMAITQGVRDVELWANGDGKGGLPASGEGDMGVLERKISGEDMHIVIHSLETIQAFMDRIKEVIDRNEAKDEPV